MKIYTKTGDTGETGLYGGPRVPKNHARIEAYGALDELNAMLGLARALSSEEPVGALLCKLQSELFTIGAELASPDPSQLKLPLVGTSEVAQLEAWIDQHEAGLPPLREFILPGGCPLAAQFHVARTVCRRAERRTVTLALLPAQEVRPELVVYLNRLSDLLFVLARWCNQAAGVAELPWQKPNAAARASAGEP